MSFLAAASALRPAATSCCSKALGELDVQLGALGVQLTHGGLAERVDLALRQLALGFLLVFHLGAARCGLALEVGTCPFHLTLTLRKACRGLGDLVLNGLALGREVLVNGCAQRVDF